MQHIMKKLILILLVFSLKGFSQDPRLFDNTWYLHDLVINGTSNVPPINNEIPFVPAEFFVDGVIYTGMCEEGGAGELEYIGTTEFDILYLHFFTGGCHQNHPYNQNYSGLYIGFWGSLGDNNPTPYEIIEAGQIRTLTITASNGDYAMYKNEVPLSITEFSNSEILIYPTLVKTSFYISSGSTNEIQKITIHNIFGQTILTSNYPQSEIDVSNLPTGIYFVSLQDYSDRITTHKIIKL